MWNFIREVAVRGHLSATVSLGSETNYAFYSGEKADWKLLLAKIQKIKTLGDEAASWYNLLRPVVTRLIKTFTHPHDTETDLFWNSIIRHNPRESGQPEYYSGWLTAFSFWGADGICLYNQDMMRGKTKKFKHGSELTQTSQEGYQLGHKLFHRIKNTDLTSGWASVDIEVDDQNRQHKM